MKAAGGWTILGLLLVMLTVSMLRVALESIADRMGVAVAERWMETLAIDPESG